MPLSIDVEDVLVVLLDVVVVLEVLVVVVVGRVVHAKVSVCPIVVPLNDGGTHSHPVQYPADIEQFQIDPSHIHSHVPSQVNISGSK